MKPAFAITLAVVLGVVLLAAALVAVIYIIATTWLAKKEDESTPFWDFMASAWSSIQSGLSALLA